MQTAADGQAGMELLHLIEKPCLTLLDLMLPIMSGWEFLAALRKEPKAALATIPVIITSAAGARAVEAAKGAEGYIKKPINLDVLLDSGVKYCGKNS